MHYKIISVIFLGLMLSCAKPERNIQKEKIQGYWEIHTVEMSNGKKREFKINPILDHIQLKGDSGIRTKVSPNLDGTFTTNGDSEKFILKMENDSLRMFYKTPFDQWKETVLETGDSILSVKNRDDKIYTYSKFVKYDFGE